VCTADKYMLTYMSIITAVVDVSYCYASTALSVVDSSKTGVFGSIHFAPQILQTFCTACDVIDVESVTCCVQWRLRSHMAQVKSDSVLILFLYCLNPVFIDQFSGPDRAISGCGSVCSVDNFWNKWSLTHLALDLIQVKFEGQGHRRKFTADRRLRSIARAENK